MLSSIPACRTRGSRQSCDTIAKAGFGFGDVNAVVVLRKWTGGAA